MHNPKIADFGQLIVITQTVIAMNKYQRLYHGKPAGYYYGNTAREALVNSGIQDDDFFIGKVWNAVPVSEQLDLFNGK